MRQVIVSVFLSLVIAVNSNVINSIFEERSINPVHKILKCVSSFDYACILDYVENSVDKVYNDLLREADAGSRRSLKETSRKKGDEEEESPSSILTSITSMLSELPELLRASLNAALSGEEGDEKTTEAADEDDSENIEGNDDGDDEEADDDEDADTDENDNNDNAESKTLEVGETCKNTTCSKVESKSNIAVKIKNVGDSRKKKKRKGKIHKLKTFIKVAIIAIVLVVKLTIVLKLLAAKLQIKFFLIALISLLINLARFWWDIKKGHHPQKVIYYEHAQHQHHYDGGDDWQSSGPGGESYWSRSYDKVDNKSAQDLAYAKQAPTGTTYSRINDKPNFSWNPWAERSL
ncbi:hypothetical protein RN001_002000 [Aquatica leii]|uniref:Uncharacterized protein n=1 Tax=Aquatica leii TaxID=1421715 RepID=A0AAN7PGJ0_9COLE|nr:hypothetical protein RN001_002000 [Aquatica leii]